MMPLFIYKCKGWYYVYALGDFVEEVPEDFKLVASIDAKYWLENLLNYDSTDRRRMIKELEGK